MAGFQVSGYPKSWMSRTYFGYMAKIATFVARHSILVAGLMPRLPSQFRGNQTPLTRQHPETMLPNMFPITQEIIDFGNLCLIIQRSMITAQTKKTQYQVCSLLWAVWNQNNWIATSRLPVENQHKAIQDDMSWTKRMGLLFLIEAQNTFCPVIPAIKNDQWLGAALNYLIEEASVGGNFKLSIFFTEDICGWDCRYSDKVKENARRHL